MLALRNNLLMAVLSFTSVHQWMECKISLSTNLLLYQVSIYFFDVSIFSVSSFRVSVSTLLPPSVSIFVVLIGFSGVGISSVSRGFQC